MYTCGPPFHLLRIGILYIEAPWKSYFYSLTSTLLLADSIVYDDDFAITKIFNSKKPSVYSFRVILLIYWIVKISYFFYIFLCWFEQVVRSHQITRIIRHHLWNCTESIAITVITRWDSTSSVSYSSVLLPLLLLAQKMKIEGYSKAELYFYWSKAVLIYIFQVICYGVRQVNYGLLNFAILPTTKIRNKN